MRRILAPAVFLIFSALLVACGGGGGGASLPSTNSDFADIVPVITSAEQSRVRVVVEELKILAADSSLSVSNKDDILTRIQEIEFAIESVRQTAAELMAKLAKLRQEIADVRVVVVTPPDDLNCGVNEMPDGQSCVCISGHEREQGVCVLSPPSCGDHEMPVGQNCVCDSGYERDQGNVCVLSPPNCGTNEMPDGQNCVCDSGYERDQGNVCVLSPSNCDTNEMPEGQNCVCDSGYERDQDNVCVLSPPSCGDHEMAVGQNCVCDSGYERDQGFVCVLSSATVICTDSRVLRDGVCTYDTPEFNRNYALRQMGALYAYQQGYHGQGVIIAHVEYSSPLSTHEDLRDAVINSLYADRPLSNDHRPGFHGTAVAGLIAAARNGRGGHGVAPEAKIVSSYGCCGTGRFSGGGRFQYLIDNGFSIYNRSEGGYGVPIFSGQIRGERWQLRVIPDYFPFEKSGSKTKAYYNNIFSNGSYSAFEGADIVMVQAAGNTGWQGPNSTILIGICTDQDENADCDFVPGDRTMELLLHEFLSEFVDEEYGTLQTLNISPFGRTANAVRPLFNPLLENNWLVAIALNKDDTIASFSNGCGDTKQWCIAAYGVGHPTTSNEGDDAYTEYFSGTSASAPHVSGALAVLKSAAPMLPMTVIRPILLTTATDLGDPGIDDVYGWGAVNISAGIVHIENLETADGKMLLSDLRGQLPSGFSHLHGRLNNVSVAIKITDNAYHNVALADLFSGGESASVPIGDAASEMLSPVVSPTGNYVSAFGNSADGVFGLQWQGGAGGFRYAAEVQHYAEEDTFMGADFGALGSLKAKTNSGKIKMHRSVFGRMSAFGEYEYKDINADAGGDGFIQAIDHARADGWTAGFEFADIWKFGDRLRLSAQRQTTISGGDLVLQYPHATGDFHSAFIGESTQEISAQTARIPLKKAAAFVYSIGYGSGYDGGEWSAAAAYNTQSGERKLSAHWEIKL